MPSLTDKELLEIISDIESDRAEFKESLSGDSPTKYEKLSAHLPTTFLNTKNRGLFS